MRKILIPILLACIGIVQAQEQPLKFSLEEAINYALEHNRTVINAQRDIEAAKKQKWETTASGLPQISAAVDYQNYLKQQVSLLPAEFLGGEPGTFEPITFGTKQSVSATATLSQLIFDGSYLVGLQSAKVYLQISENAKQKTDLQIKEMVIEAYGNVLLSDESITILERNKSVLEKNLNETQQMFENGLSEEENVEQLQITLLQIETTLTNAKRLKKLAYDMLKVTIGVDIRDEIELTDDLDALAIENIDLDLIEAEFILENNIDYKIAKNTEISQELLLKLAKSNGLPTLSAFINGGYQGYADKEFTFLNSTQDWFGSSLFGVSLNVPIFSSLARSAATQRARIELEQAKTDLTETEQQLLLGFDQAKSEYQYAIEYFETTLQNLELAERIEHKNQVKYTEGIATSFELRQAQTQLYTAQQEYLQAMLDVITKRASLETILNN
ncbi:TolC family protein [Neptunitalea lumnitzerae]|uniref:Transporter n=1 Tax=Neptunitalea lumnitzerae TaxID=2965509 RepID=A0ABQ5MER9_9FLAO|nr:TolC family protein [Neptunitalea sp. Y10]GLB47895.1 transporter [Neptunitalea sp. Y10]